MIRPTRTELLRLRERAAAVETGVTILNARRQALVREFLAAVTPFLASRQALRSRYREALDELALTRVHEGEELLEALCASVERNVSVELTEKNVMGVHCRQLQPDTNLARPLDGRGYDYTSTTTHLEEAVSQFEHIVGEMLEIAAYESRLKKLGEEIRRVTTRTRILEERVLPGLQGAIREIGQHLAERERETHFRLKRFKELRAGKTLNRPAAPPDASTRSVRTAW